MKCCHQYIKDSFKHLSTNYVIYLFTPVIHVKTGLKGLFTQLCSLLLFNKPLLDNAYSKNNLFKKGFYVVQGIKLCSYIHRKYLGLLTIINSPEVSYAFLQKVIGAHRGTKENWRPARDRMQLTHARYLSWFPFKRA